VLPRLEVVRRSRPVSLLTRGSARAVEAGVHPMPVPAPYVGVVLPLTGSPASVALRLGDHRLAATLDADLVELRVTHGATTSTHRSRRHGRAAEPTELGLTLTGSHLTAWCRERGGWVARARRDLRDDPSTGSGRRLDVHDEAALAALRVETSAPGTAGLFGQLGLRDLRFVSHEDGTPVHEDGRLWLTATSAGPGFFDSGHTSVWGLDPRSLEVVHTGDLFFRRPDRPGVYGDHATHLVRRADGWLVATSTWGDFEQPASRSGRRAPSGLRVTLAEATGDLLRGTHVLDTRELPLPATGDPTIATWDPHLVRRGEAWWVGYVAASRFFRFHPALATGHSLDDLRLAGAARERVATEGTTLLEVDGELLVLASDGRDGRRGQRAAYPVFGTDLARRGSLDAPYPTNIPWPTLARDGDGWLMVTFNGRRTGGELLGYGTHGDLVVLRSV